MKTCTKCGLEKSLDDFNNEVKRNDGKYPWCRECLSQYRRERYTKIPRNIWITQKVCSKCKEWKPRDQYKINSSHNLHYRCMACEDFDTDLVDKGLFQCTSCRQIKPLDCFYKSRRDVKKSICIDCDKAYHKREDVRLRQREYNLQKRFGITLDQYEELLKRQDYACPICLKSFDKGVYKYPVDHAHSGPNAGVIRAILHDVCNRFIVRDHTDPEVLKRAAHLLENPYTDWYVPEEYVKPKKKRKKRVKREKLL